MDIETYKRQFHIPEAVAIENGEGGLQRISVSCPAASGEIYLNGATLTKYQPFGGSPVIFCSSNSKFENGKAIRGGVPIIFPWFGAHPGDPAKGQHGFARTAVWEIEATRLNEDGSVTVTLKLSSSDATLAVWPHEFQLRYSITLGAELTMEFAVTNRSSEPFRYEEALHTYFTVSDVQSVRLEGLQNLEYIDKVDGGKRRQSGESAISLEGETDRVYLATAGPYILRDDTGRTIRISNEGSDCTVVWNPWETKAEAMADLKGGQWPRFICVEAVNCAEYAITLAPNATHKMICRIESS